MVTEGFSIAVIGYRGFGWDAKGKVLKLTTPRTFSGASWDDFIEPANYIKEKYCGERKVVALAISMGGIVLTGSIPKLDFLSAAVILCTPLEPNKSRLEMADFYKRVLGNKLIGMWEDNAEMLTPEYKRVAGHDLIERINGIRQAGALTADDHDELFISPMFGFKD